jgi:hypothetical protein
MRRKEAHHTINVKMGSVSTSSVRLLGDETLTSNLQASWMPVYYRTIRVLQPTREFWMVFPPEHFLYGVAPSLHGAPGRAVDGIRTRDLRYPGDNFINWAEEACPHPNEWMQLIIYKYLVWLKGLTHRWVNDADHPISILKILTLSLL